MGEVPLHGNPHLVKVDGVGTVYSASTIPNPDFRNNQPETRNLKRIHVRGGHRLDGMGTDPGRARLGR